MEHFREYTCKTNIGVHYGLGIILVVEMITQIHSGFSLSLGIGSRSVGVFTTLMQLENDSTGMSFLRKSHAGGPSIIFFLLYVHIFKAYGLTEGGFKKNVYNTGLLMLVIAWGTAFTGYSLVGGSMSQAALKVIISFIEPLTTKSGIELVNGSQGVNSSVISSRLWAVHYILGISFLGTITVHLLALHKVNNSRSEDGKENGVYSSTFWSSVYIKDILY